MLVEAELSGGGRDDKALVAAQLEEAVPVQIVVPHSRHTLGAEPKYELVLSRVAQPAESIQFHLPRVQLQLSRNPQSADFITQVAVRPPVIKCRTHVRVAAIRPASVLKGGDSELQV